MLRIHRRVDWRLHDLPDVEGSEVDGDLEEVVPHRAGRLRDVGLGLAFWFKKTLHFGGSVLSSHLVVEPVGALGKGLVRDGGEGGGGDLDFLQEIAIDISFFGFRLT